MTDEQIMKSYERACKREFEMDTTKENVVLVYPKAEKGEDQEMIKLKWFRLIEMLIERKLI